VPTIPVGYISLADAKSKLGLKLIGQGWIENLTARESWLVDKHNKGSSSAIISGRVTCMSTSGVPFPFHQTELGAALTRDETMRSQHEQVEEWLEYRELIFEEDHGDEVIAFVPLKRFEAELRAAGFSMAGRGAETKCVRWLRSIGAAELKKRGKTHWKRAARGREELQGLSGRGFYRAWTNVATAYPEISGAGAKPKKA
jgi:hypothetical protein